MSAVAFNMFRGDAVVAAMPLTIVFGALSGWLVRKYGPADLQRIGFKFGAGFQTTAVVATLVGGMGVNYLKGDDYPNVSRALVGAFSYALSYYALNKKWPMSHKAALVNFALAGIFTQLTLLRFKQLSAANASSAASSRGGRRT